MKKLILPLFFLNSLFISANNDKNSLGGKAAGMGNASVTFSDVYAVFSNQAGLADLEGISIGIYAENRFLISDLNLFAAAFAYPTKSGTFGLGVVYFGNSGYNETKIGLAYGRKLFEKISVGAELDYVGLAIEEHGGKSTFTFGIGLQYNINKLISVGAHVYNPMRISLTDVDTDKLPSIIKFGLSFTPSDKILIATEAEHNIDSSTMFKFGLDYNVIDKLNLRAGFSTNPTAFTFGVGLELKSFGIDIAGGYHPVLGYSPALSVNPVFARNN